MTTRFRGMPDRRTNSDSRKAAHERHFFIRFHSQLRWQRIQAMTKTTFYLVIGVLLLTDFVQGRCKLKIAAEKKRKADLLENHLKRAGH